MEPQKTYRSQSVRLKDYDYSQTGAYFVTICTHNREPNFGTLVDGQMVLNELGKAVTEEWLLTGRFRDNVVMDEFIVMPNHFHGILIIPDRTDPNTSRSTAQVENFGKPTVGSVPTIVRSFKSAVSRRINAIRPGRSNPVWQSNYYEHVIRDEEDLQRLRQYILYNALKWDQDSLNPDRGRKPEG